MEESSTDYFFGTIISLLILKVIQSNLACPRKVPVYRCRACCCEEIGPVGRKLRITDVKKGHGTSVLA